MLTEADQVIDKPIEGILAKLKVFYPDRATAVMHVLATQNEVSKLIPEWREKQLLSITELLNSFVTDLVRAYEEKRIITLTWLARSLFELSIWVRYCNSDEENAKRFSDDSMRDFYGYCKGLQTILEKRGMDQTQVATLMKRFSAYAKEQGIDALADNFMKVSDAAAALGEAKEFAAQNKVYSKLAHPTAFALGLAFSRAREQSFLDIFLFDGAQYAMDALIGVRDFVLIMYPNPSPISSW
jgi:hypothetical protein